MSSRDVQSDNKHNTSGDGDDDESSVASRKSKKEKKAKKEKKSKKEKKEEKPAKLERTDSFGKRFINGVKHQVIDVKDAVRDTAAIVGALPRRGSVSAPDSARTASSATAVSASPNSRTADEDSSSSAAPNGAQPVNNFAEFSRVQNVGLRRSTLNCSTPILETCDYDCKIVLCGPASVGKTSLRLRLCDDQWESKTQSTIGVELSKYFYETWNDCKTIRVMVWDTGGAERFKSVTPQFYRGAHAIVAVYAVDNLQSYENVAGAGGYIADAQNYCGFTDPLKQPLVMMIGNKLDVHNRKVEMEKVRSFCEGQRFMYFETSAKTNVNVERAFQELIEAVYMERLRPTMTPLGRVNSNSSQVRKSTHEPSAWRGGGLGGGMTPPMRAGSGTHVADVLTTRNLADETRSRLASSSTPPSSATDKHSDIVSLAPPKDGGATVNTSTCTC